MYKYIRKLPLSILFCFLVVNYLHSHNEVISKIQTTVEYKDQELIFAIFVNIGDCIKCIQVPINILDCALKKVSQKNDTILVKKLAIVNCNRDVELKRFRKIYNWEGYCFINTNDTVQKSLGLPLNTLVAIIDKDSCVYYFTYDTYEKDLNCQNLIKLLEKFKNR